MRRPVSVRIGMFCRFGSVDESAAGGGDGLIEGGVDAAVVGYRLEQAVHGDLEAGRVAVFEQVLQERVLRLLVEAFERVGVGGVAGLGALGLRHIEFVEQHHLQLLGRAEIDLLADHRVGGIGGLGDPVGEFALQLLELVGVDRDSGLLQIGEHGQQRQFHIAEQGGGFDAFEFGIEGVGEFGNGLGAQDFGLGDLFVGLILVIEQRAGPRQRYRRAVRASDSAGPGRRD